MKVWKLGGGESEKERKAGRTQLLTALAHRAALLRLIFWINTLCLRASGHRTKNLSTGLTTALLAGRHLETYPDKTQKCWSIFNTIRIYMRFNHQSKKNKRVLLWGNWWVFNLIDEQASFLPILEYINNAYLLPPGNTSGIAHRPSFLSIFMSMGNSESCLTLGAHSLWISINTCLPYLSDSSATDTFIGFIFY